MEDEYLKYWDLAKKEINKKLKFVPKKLRKGLLKMLELSFKSGYYAKKQEKS